MHWSIRKLCVYLAENTARKVIVGRERLRQVLDANKGHVPADQDVEGVAQ